MNRIVAAGCEMWLLCAAGTITLVLCVAVAAQVSPADGRKESKAEAQPVKSPLCRRSLAGRQHWRESPSLLHLPSSLLPCLPLHTHTSVSLRESPRREAVTWVPFPPTPPLLPPPMPPAPHTHLSVSEGVSPEGGGDVSPLPSYTSLPPSSHISHSPHTPYISSTLGSQ